MVWMWRHSDTPAEASVLFWRGMADQDSSEPMKTTLTRSGLLNLIWPTFMGGCDLCRDTESRLRQAGKWSSVDLAMPVDEPWWSTTPHTYGILTK